MHNYMNYKEQYCGSVEKDIKVTSTGIYWATLSTIVYIPVSSGMFFLPLH